MTEERRRQEIEEAVRAGKKALTSLRMAQDKLASAKSWGILDIIGGGLVTSMVKHSRLNDASFYLESAKTDLKTFRRELKDIPDFSDLGIDIGNFLSFADVFLDGLVADWMVQRKIEDARKQVDNGISQIEMLLRRLELEKGV